MEKKRIIGFDILKCILIFSVIFLHNDRNNTMWIINKYFTSFHMSLFVAISGYFFNKETQKDTKKFLKDKIYRILIPFIIWDFIGLVEENIGEIIQGRNIKIEWCKFLLVQESYNATWFLLAMFLNLVFERIIYDNIKSEKKIFIINNCVCVIGFIMAYKNVPNFFRIVNAMIFCGPFTLGRYVGNLENRMNIDDKSKRKVTIISMLCIFMGGILAFVNGEVHMSSLQFSNTLLCICSSILSNFGYLILFNNLKFEKIENKILNLITFFGKNSMCILVTHFSIILILRMLSEKIYKDKYSFPVILGFVIILLCEILVIKILNDFFPLMIGIKKKEMKEKKI